MRSSTLVGTAITEVDNRVDAANVTVSCVYQYTLGCVQYVVYNHEHTEFTHCHTVQLHTNHLGLFQTSSVHWLDLTQNHSLLPPPMCSW